MARQPHPYIKNVTFTPTGESARALQEVRERRAENEPRDPFAPPTRCPVCGGVSEKYCKACDSSGVFVRTGIFRAHSCARCRDGALPERCPSKVPGNCGEPHARND